MNNRIHLRNQPTAFERARDTINFFQSSKEVNTKVGLTMTLSYPKDLGVTVLLMRKTKRALF